MPVTSQLNYKEQIKMLIETNQMNDPDQNMVVRFPMIYDSKCLNVDCPHPSIGAGVRYNAKKKTIGKYLDAIKIYEFTMKCANCDNEFKI